MRSIGDLSIDFTQEGKAGQLVTRKQTLLLGQNGTGKSSLLRAIALLTAGSSALGELLGNADEWIRNTAKQCVLEAVLTTKDGEPRPLRLELNRGNSLKDVISNNAESINLLEAALEHAERNYFVVGYGASRRLNTGENAWFSQRGTFQSARANNVSTLFRNDAELNPLTAWAIDLHYQTDSTTEGLDIIRESLEGLLPGVRFHSINKAKKQLLFESTDGIVPLHLLSDGYQNMTAWIGDLLYRISSSFHDYKMPLNARGLLLIDEVDLHIHPVWQRHLLNFLKSKLPNFQIVATTHSPLTAQQAAEGELYSLQRSAATDNVELVPFYGDPQKMLLHQLMLSDAFGVETDESLVAVERKNAYRALRNKPKLSPSERKKMRELSDDIRVLPTAADYPNALVSKEQMVLMNELAKELSKKGI
ncbi:hypothetical protein GCM10023185_34960 [Hymenobacter saemangeumensis]|uniref:AAA+ ATPase domain-containing protein n=2 Tax=Hymenobacter saemangeumensis TaxID=1084522 RepID=A0ABP8IP70_9BACT